MFVRTLAGLYAGQVIDVPNDSAMAMLADGRALRPDVPYEVYGGGAFKQQSPQVPEDLQNAGHRQEKRVVVDETVIEAPASPVEPLVTAGLETAGIETAPPPRRVSPATVAGSTTAQMPARPGSMSIRGKRK
jgi:hypothetical protein